MAFKTISRNMQRWASNSGGSSKPKKGKPYISKWVRDWLDKEDRKRGKTTNKNKKHKSKKKAVNKAKNRAKKLSKTRQRYGHAVLRMYAYRLAIPDPPKKLRKEIGEMRPVEWVQTFYNWEQVYNHYLERRDAGDPIKAVQPCIIALRMPESYLKEVLHSFKNQIARALVLGKQMPGVPKALKGKLGGTDQTSWFESLPDSKKYLKDAKKSGKK